MREILFRGKRNDSWCVGGLLYDEENNKAFIAEHFEDKAAYLREVIPETVGQYTGLTDKNGKKIFEGDIVKARVTENTGYGTKKYESIYEIKYHEKYCYFYLAREKNNLLFDGNWSYFVSQFEIIGNIHDNPELLKGE